MLSGVGNESFPTLGEWWHVPQVPGITDRPSSSFNPDTPAMLIGLLLNRAWPRAMLARSRFTTEPADCRLDQASNNRKITGEKPSWNGLKPRSGRFMFSAS